MEMISPEGWSAIAAIAALLLSEKIGISKSESNSIIQLVGVIIRKIFK